jgi:hypothetical protein
MSKKVRVYSAWIDDYGDIDANVEFYKDNKFVANCVCGNSLDNILDEYNKTIEKQNNDILLTTTNFCNEYIEGCPGESRDLIKKKYNVDSKYSKFLCEDNLAGKFIALDDTTGDCWVEDFNSEIQARAYLHGLDRDDIFIVNPEDDDYETGIIDLSSDTNMRDLLENDAMIHFDEYCNLPKLSQAPKLLQTMYNDLSQSENEMFYLENEDWQESLDSGEYTNKDLDSLKEYVMQHKLNDYITFKEDDNVVTCYYGLLRKFNDDLSISKDKELDI